MTLADLGVVVPVASAQGGLTINLIRHYDGEIFELTLYADPPVNATGAGNLDDIMRAAARHWEQAVNDDVTIDLHYGWHAKPEGNNNLGGAGPLEISEDGTTVTAKLFLNRTYPNWWLDSTPETAEEFAAFVQITDDLGGGDLVVSNSAAALPGEAQGRIDAVTVAIHELGHVVGHAALYPNYLNATGSSVDSGYIGELTVPPPYQFDGTVVPTLYSHPNMSGPVMSGSGISGSRRRVLSDVDILMAAVIAEYDSVNLFGDPPIVTQGFAGDVNCDGSITVADVAKAMSASVGLVAEVGACPLENPTVEFNGVAADLNGDGFVTVVDVSLLMQCVVGLPEAIC